MSPPVCGIWSESVICRAWEASVRSEIRMAGFSLLSLWVLCRRRRRRRRRGNSYWMLFLFLFGRRFRFLVGFSCSPPVERSAADGRVQSRFTRSDLNYTDPLFFARMASARVSTGPCFLFEFLWPKGRDTTEMDLLFAGHFITGVSLESRDGRPPARSN